MKCMVVKCQTKMQVGNGYNFDVNLVINRPPPLWYWHLMYLQTTFCYCLTLIKMLSKQQNGLKHCFFMLLNNNYCTWTFPNWMIQVIKYGFTKNTAAHEISTKCSCEEVVFNLKVTVNSCVPVYYLLKLFNSELGKKL
jgi:hypothetical protein